MLTFYYIYLYVKESSPPPPPLKLKNTCIYPPLEFQKILPGSAPVTIITRNPKGTQHGVTKEEVVHMKTMGISLDCIACPWFPDAPLGNTSMGHLQPSTGYQSTFLHRFTKISAWVNLRFWNFVLCSNKLWKQKIVCLEIKVDMIFQVLPELITSDSNCYIMAFEWQFSSYQVT